MKLCIQTIVLDGEPFIEWHLPVFQKLKFDWKWIIIHGAAQNNGSTSWCNPQQPRLSLDGTTEYLHGIKDKRVHLIERADWESKDEMCNAALPHYPCVLMEIDHDEIWRSEQIDTIVETFIQHQNMGSMMFQCDYYVGPDLVLKGEHCYGDNDYEWLRAWRFKPGMTFRSHEPPVLLGETGYCCPKEQSTKLIGKFSHYAYATEAQVKYKEKYYGYLGLTDQWRWLQANENFPVSLSRFFSHVHGEQPLVVKQT